MNYMLNFDLNQRFPGMYLPAKSTHLLRNIALIVVNPDFNLRSSCRDTSTDIKPAIQVTSVLLKKECRR